MAAAAVYLPDARKGKSEAAFYVGAMHVVEAAFQKKRGSHESAIMKLEDSALYWLRVAANGGNEEARALLQQVKKHGKAGLYFISLEHLFSGQPDPERDFGRYRWPNGPPKHH